MFWTIGGSCFAIELVQWTFTDNGRFGMDLNAMISNDNLVLPQQPCIPFPGIIQSLPKSLQSFTKSLNMSSVKISISQGGKVPHCVTTRMHFAFSYIIVAMQFGANLGGGTNLFRSFPQYWAKASAATVPENPPPGMKLSAFIVYIRCKSINWMFTPASFKCYKITWLYLPVVWLETWTLIVVLFIVFSCNTFRKYW